MAAVLPCRILVRKTSGENDGNAVQLQKATLLPPKDVPDVGDEIRTKWMEGIITYFGQDANHRKSIRPWDFVAKLDGSVESLARPQLKGDQSTTGSQVYPTRFRIPQSILAGLEEEEQVRRTEMFALGSLIYEIMSKKQPFEDLSDAGVQRNFANGEFPKDAAELPHSLRIFAGWSEEFSKELVKRGIVKKPGLDVLQAVKNYVKAHPIRTGAYATSLTLSIATPLWFPAVLGAVGFTGSGVAAGTLASAWHASLPLAEAGSLFALCQSAGAGGAALGIFHAAGVVAGGVGVAGVGLAEAGLARAGGSGPVLTRVANYPGLEEVFKSGFWGQSKL